MSLVSSDLWTWGYHQVHAESMFLCMLAGTFLGCTSRLSRYLRHAMQSVLLDFVLNAR